MITVPRLIAAGIAPTQAKVFAGPLAAACKQYEINTPVRIAAFLAQTAHESAGFSKLEEDLYYRAPERVRQIFPVTVPTMRDAATLIRNGQKLANRVYAGKNGNGDEASGDGWKYRGRGLLQLSGRANYAAATRSPARDYEAHPEAVAEPVDACLTSAWFWASTRCNDLADNSDIDGVTRRVNGPAMAGADDRRNRFRESLTAFLAA